MSTVRRLLPIIYYENGPSHNIFIIKNNGKIIYKYKKCGILKNMYVAKKDEIWGDIIMGYKLKTLLMKNVIAKKQKDKPFDYIASENYTLDQDADPAVNNSYYFSAHGTETKESLYCRLGVRSSHSEVWFYYANGTNRYALKTMLYKENVPLKVDKSENGWRIEYRGELTREDNTKAEAEFEGEFTSEAPPVDFFSHMPPIRTAKAMAGEKWSRQFFDEVQSNNQVHYEQTGRLCGTLRIDGRSIPIDLPCVRDHSFGKRDWNYMNNHLWLMAVNDTSQLNFSMVSYPAMSVLEVGNYKAANKPMAYMTEATYDRSSVVKGSVPEKLELSLTLNDKSRLHIVAEKTDEERYLFQGGDYCLIEGVGEFTINGEPFRGIIEIGFNREKSRIFNGKDIHSLKV